MDDEAYARQLQSEFNALSGSRSSRASGSGSGTRPKVKKVVKKKKRSAATVDSGDEEGPKKKRATPNTAFNKDLILRYVPSKQSHTEVSNDGQGTPSC